MTVSVALLVFDLFRDNVTDRNSVIEVQRHRNRSSQKADRSFLFRIRSICQLEAYYDVVAIIQARERRKRESEDCRDH